ncbi:protein-tyrosine phosphatase-like protein [Halteromyces radiatus]|uniref:protein-tyrosine phosphatase-like protein n=1 Tax=Halteromyces radiatus TaxID=101107 RepID=UPI00221EF098|nr:protein-tyrosine phosphatase-like protein [Halteromyces radiatus]KAI8096619.1 protein-tyrosine phosphatase-like protein [Halteromyces radiatus]
MITVVESPLSKQRFLLLDAPTEQTLASYIEPLKKENVKLLVRICNRPLDYDAVKLERLAGIRVIDDIKFDDGTVPSQENIEHWLNLAEQARLEGHTMAVHCVSGIGRAPVLVTLSLIESGMDPLDAISYVRQRRRGALNKTQVRFIDGYRPITKRNKWRQWFKLAV